MKNLLTGVAIVAAVAGWGLYAYQQGGLFKTDQGGGEQRAEAPAVDPDKLNPISQGAAKLGVRDCLARINQVSGFITAQSQSAAVMFASPQRPNKSVAGLSMEVQTAKGLSYTSASFAPVGSDGCGAIYDAVVYWENTCDDVAKKAFAELKPLGKLREQILQLDGGQTMRVFLMPAGAGCLSIKKELVY